MLATRGVFVLWRAFPPTTHAIERSFQQSRLALDTEGAICRRRRIHRGDDCYMLPTREMKAAQHQM